jgi:hypothetical protein
VQHSFLAQARERASVLSSERPQSVLPPNTELREAVAEGADVAVTVMIMGDEVECAGVDFVNDV